MNRIASLLIIFLFFLAPVITSGQAPPPPPPPEFPSGPENRVGGGAALEDSVTLLLGLAFLYGAYRTRRLLKKEKESAV